MALLPQITGPSLAPLGPRWATSAPRFVPRAAPEGAGEPPAGGDASAGSPPPAARIRTTPPPGRAFPPPPPGALNPNMQLQKVEKLGAASVEGVARVEPADAGGASLPRAVALAAGDAAALLLFASIGRFNHHEALTLAGALETAGPFLLGWFVAAPLLGGFGKEAQGGEVGPALGAAAKSWAVAAPLAIAVRSLLRGYVPDRAFIIVSLVATAVLLLGWRAAAASLAPSDAGAKSKSRKKGNPFEFFTLLFSLVKRW